MNTTKAVLRLEQRMRPLLARPWVLHSLGSMRRRLEARGLADLNVTIDGFRLTGGLADRRLLACVQEKTFEPLSLQLWQKGIAPGTKVVDIGAHVGVYSLFAAQAAGTEGQIWAVEPNPVSRRLLVKNVRSNGLQNVTVIASALSDRNGTSTLHVRPGDRMQSSLVAVDAGSEHDVSVRVARLDDLIPPDIDIDIVKMDAEGSEPAILRGMARLLPKVRMMIIESNANCLYQARSSPDALHAILMTSGFEVHLIDEQSQRLSPWSHEHVNRRSINLLATRASSIGIALE